MQAWICDNPVGVDALKWVNMDDPEPGPNEVVVAVRAASLNFPDLLIVHGRYQIKPPLPFIPGSEFSGEILSVGANVTRFKVGDRVAAMGSTGGFATHALVHHERLVALPDSMSFEAGAAYAFTYGTAHHSLVDRGALQAGETVFILGAAGGVGTASIQIAKALGARVIAGASNADKCALCKSIGADETIDYGTDNLRDALARLTDKRGPDVVVDPVGGDFAEPVFRAIAWRGRYLVVGFAHGKIPVLPFNLPLLKGASLVGVFWGDHVRREPEAHRRAMDELAAWFGQGKIAPVIDQVYAMSDLHQAYSRMSNRQAMGKLVMVHR
jgi:NADPH2:quinone reductase